MGEWLSRRGMIAGVLVALSGIAHGPAAAKKKKRRRKKRCNCTGQMFNLPSVAYDACCVGWDAKTHAACEAILEACATSTPLGNPKSCKSCKRVINAYWACIEKPGALTICKH